MYSMCQYCGAELTQPRDEKKEHDNLKTLPSDRACKACAEKQERGSIKQANGMSRPTISPMTSLSSSDSSVSNCSEFSVDVNSYDRTAGTNNDRLWEPPSVNTCDSPSETENSNSSEVEMDHWIWDPPEPDDPEDDVEGSVAFNDDDDDECGDGMKWGKPSSLSRSKDEGSGSYKFKEEKQRAMEAVINGKFKALVSQLLTSVGVVGSSGEDGESWVDIITSLSWEAASFLKPDAVVSKAMDPDGYVKVKCIATGDRCQSQLVKGMVFKKHAAHKHMPIKYKNPRLLLIQGVLGQSSSGLSSFDSMEQEQDYLKYVTEMLELCHPNVVLVEKTVSRDIQESILAKRMTLVYDMKLHRLQRIALCTGSPILSSDTMTSQKLKQCDSFHIEKFIEERAGLGGGKMPSKTLMFIEGCPTRQGCTILLKGAQSDELKKIKCVVQCAVILAYHLILETSFLVDQRAMFFAHPLFGGANHVSIEVANQFSTGNKSFNLASSNSCIPHHRESSGETESEAVDILISDGFHEGSSQNADLELQGSSTLYEPYNPVIFSGFSSLSASLKKVIGESLPLSSTSYQSLSSYFGLNGRELNGQITKSVSISTSPEATDQCDVEDRGSSDEERPLSGGEIQSPFTCTEASLEIEKDGGNNEDPMQSKNDISKVLDSQSILVLMSSKNVKGNVCEQSHFSHIMFYKNFDVPIGKFLQDNILNQRSHCTSCGELPEAHVYCYAHHNKQLTIRVKRLLTEHLPGEAEGKLWMWSRCGKCKSVKGKSKCTKRVLISSAARCLSFGNFLELSFSNHSLSNIFSSCGHSLQTDFLYFFGLGPMVAMFKNSPVTIYTVSVPPLKLPFSNSIRQEWFAKEIENVLEKGRMLLSEVGNSLKRIRSQFDGMTLKLQGSLKKFSDIEDMLSQEESEQEVNIRNAVNENRNSDQAAYKLLGFNRVHWELLLQSCVWDQRLHSLLSPTPMMIHSIASDKVSQEVNSGIHGTAESIMGRGENCIDGSSNLKVELDIAAEADEFPIKEIPIGGPVEESEGADQHIVSTLPEGLKTPNVGGASPKRFADHESNPRPNGSTDGHSDKYVEGNITFADELDEDRGIPVSRENEDPCSVVDSNLSLMGASPHSRSSKFDSSSDWFWAPFSEIRQVGMKDLQRVLPRFGPMSSYTSEYLPTAYQLITEEGQMLHIPLGTDYYIVSDYDGELSSVIACALAFLKDPPLQTDVLVDDESGIAARTFESLQSLARVPSLHQSSNGSSDSDSVHSMASISFDESRFSSFDGLNLLDSLVPAGTHPMVTLRVAKSPGKEKYTVLCPYANQFRDLRNRCCQSEVDYIASLSRCRNWDAKGGKSKAFFAKTVDDRLIIKEIKKTEFESFVKFADAYFEHVNKSFEKGNQTCLAKILGIYQVVVRQTKSGKEMKHDLMVMENLTFGRNCTRLYDLKGALHDRFNLAPAGAGDVLLDQNFVNDMNSSPFYVSNQEKQKLQRALWNDTSFLNSINVMDYSLLVGIDTHRQELVCGIIDYLRQYTWDKHLESWVKSSLVPKNVLPTVISPKEYKRRFRKFMSKNICSVPDHWCSSESSDPCDEYAARNADSPKQNPKGKGG
ncbi:putative 1-phosphatidylinositol-3-phosphate 5-kinase FAB1D [Rosa sericea]